MSTEPNKREELEKQIYRLLPACADYKCADIDMGPGCKNSVAAIVALLASERQQLEEENKTLRHVINYYLGDDYMAEHSDPKEWRAEANRRSIEDSKEDQIALEQLRQQWVEEVRSFIQTTCKPETQDQADYQWFLLNSKILSGQEPALRRSIQKGEGRE